MINLSWTTQKRKISELIEFNGNPRRLTKKQYEDLKKSVSKFNLVEIPAINLDGTLLAGHQRLKILRELQGDIEIDVRVPNRQLSPAEAKEYLIRSNKNTGEWDFDMLANGFDTELLAWGFMEKDFFNFGSSETVQIPEEIMAGNMQRTENSIIENIKICPHCKKEIK